MKTPVTLFSGFLGSGKTTLISHLIDELQAQGIQVVYLKNEIGDENIDTQLLKGKHIQTRELLNGCICCTLVGPFISAINEIITTYKPDRIVIEASGVADPSAVALMVSNHPLLFRDGVITVIDVLNFEGYQDLSQTARNQATFTDLIVFNKVELADLNRKQAVVGYVRELNPYAPILEAPDGRVAPEVIIGISTTELSHQLAHLEQHDHHHLEKDQLSSQTISLPSNLTPAELQARLRQLPPSIFRVKGILADRSGHQWLVNKVGQRVEITELDLKLDQSLLNKVVCIGFVASNWQQQAKEMLTSVAQPQT